MFAEAGGYVEFHELEGQAQTQHYQYLQLVLGQQNQSAPFPPI